MIFCLEYGIIYYMYNWAIAEKELKKDTEKYTIWRLEQMVNFGLNNEKISARQLKKYWTKLDLDPRKKEYLAFLLWPSQR